MNHIGLGEGQIGSIFRCMKLLSIRQVLRLQLLLAVIYDYYFHEQGHGVRTWTENRWTDPTKKTTICPQSLQPGRNRPKIPHTPTYTSYTAQTHTKSFEIGRRQDWRKKKNNNSSQPDTETCMQVKGDISHKQIYHHKQKHIPITDLHKDGH